MVNLLLLDETEDESQEAISILKEKGLQFNIVDVNKNGFRDSLWRDYRTYEIPTLVTNRGTFIGLEDIQNSLEKILRV